MDLKKIYFEFLLETSIEGSPGPWNFDSATNVLQKDFFQNSEVPGSNFEGNK